MIRIKRTASVFFCHVIKNSFLFYISQSTIIVKNINKIAKYIFLNLEYN